MEHIWNMIFLISWNSCSHFVFKTVHVNVQTNSEKTYISMNIALLGNITK